MRGRWGGTRGSFKFFIQKFYDRINLSSLKSVTSKEDYLDNTKTIEDIKYTDFGGIHNLESTTQFPKNSGPPPPPPPAWSTSFPASVGTGGAGNYGPINIWYRRTIGASVYTAAEIQAATGKTSGDISGLRLFVQSSPLYQPLPNYAIGIKEGSFTSATTNPGNTGYTVVKNPSSESFSAGSTKEFTFNTPFTWNGGDLAIVWAWGQSPTGYSQSGTVTVGSGTFFGRRSDAAGTYVINLDSTNASQADHRPVIQLFV